MRTERDFRHRHRQVLRGLGARDGGADKIRHRRKDELTITFSIEEISLIDIFEDDEKYYGL